MFRRIKISINHASLKKKNRLASFLRDYRSAVNFFIKSLWLKRGKMDNETRRRLKNTSLHPNQISAALRQAISIVCVTKKAAKKLKRKCSCPVFKGHAILDSHLVLIEKGNKSFDYVVRISSLIKNRRIIIPFKSHKRLNHWLAKGGIIKNTVNVSENSAILVIELPDKPLKTEGETTGLDIGYNKLISDSNENHYGTNIKGICDNIRRKKPGSIGARKARTQRKQYINKVCKDLPWQTTKTFVLENLTNLKKGKGNRGKKNRKLLQPWTYSQVKTRISQLAQENRVCLDVVDPRNTSRTCPLCGWVDKENRKGENFHCVVCNYTNDADTVGAMNILAKTFGTSEESLVPWAVCGELETSCVSDFGLVASRLRSYE